MGQVLAELLPKFRQPLASFAKYAYILLVSWCKLSTRIFLLTSQLRVRELTRKLRRLRQSTRNHRTKGGTFRNPILRLLLNHVLQGLRIRGRIVVQRIPPRGPRLISHRRKLVVGQEEKRPVTNSPVEGSWIHKYHMIRPMMAPTLVISNSSKLPKLSRSQLQTTRSRLYHNDF